MNNTVLIVEDDKHLGTLFGKRLQHAGFKVMRAKDGVQGLEVAQNVRPDVILLDHQMPVMTGAEMLERLRASDWGHHIAVVLTTAANIYTIPSLDLADAVLQKPVTTQELVDTIQRLASSEKAAV